MLSTVLISCDNRIKYIDSYVIEKNGKYGLIDSLGNEILPPAYLQVRKNSNSGLAIVVLDTIISHNTEKRNTLSLLLQPHDTPHSPPPSRLPPIPEKLAAGLFKRCQYQRMC